MTTEDTLRIPAFLRKKQLDKKAKQNVRRTPTRVKVVAKKVAPQAAKVIMPKTVKPKLRTLRAPKPVEKKVLLKRQKTRPVVIKRPAAPKLIPIGLVTHYYDKIQVAVMKLSGTLTVGDRLQFTGKDGIFQQVVESLQIDHEEVEKAKKGALVGLKVSQPLKDNELAYSIKI